MKGHAVFTDAKIILVNGKDHYKGLKFLIATGASTKIPPVKGLEKVHYHTNRTLFEQETLPESMIVFGGGYIALEIAQTWQ